MSKLTKSEEKCFDNFRISKPDNSIFDETKYFIHNIFKNCKGLVEIRALRMELARKNIFEKIN